MSNMSIKTQATYINIHLLQAFEKGARTGTFVDEEKGSVRAFYKAVNPETNKTQQYLLEFDYSKFYLEGSLTLYFKGDNDNEEYAQKILDAVNPETSDWAGGLDYEIDKIGSSITFPSFYQVLIPGIIKGWKDSLPAFMQS